MGTIDRKPRERVKAEKTKQTDGVRGTNVHLIPKPGTVRCTENQEGEKTETTSKGSESWEGGCGKQRKLLANEEKENDRKSDRCGVRGEESTCNEHI